MIDLWNLDCIKNIDLTTTWNSHISLVHLGPGSIPPQMSVSFKSFQVPSKQEKIGFSAAFSRPECALVSSNPHSRRPTRQLSLFSVSDPISFGKVLYSKDVRQKKTLDTSERHQVKLLLTKKYFKRQCHDNFPSSNTSCQILISRLQCKLLGNW